jgi:hypothetical protein
MDSIKVQYEADIAKFHAQLKELEKHIQSVENKATSSSKKTEEAYEKQSGIVNRLKSNIQKLTEARDKSNNPKLLDLYNQKIDAANAKLKKLTTSHKEVEKNVLTLKGAIEKVTPVLAAAFAVEKIIAFGVSIVETTAKFQRFQAVLTNTLGSSSAAAQALKMIQDFAADTPFQVDELTDSFVKLANQGFIPTREELRKLGDLAASQGKSFNQLTEAMIDARTGEFERLKEFGIRASKEGDRVKFTFKGVETQTKFTGKAIDEYILSLGDLQGVTGGMAAQSKTLGGQLSNLEDTITDLKNTIGQFLAPAISSIVNGIKELVGSSKDLKVLGFVFSGIFAPVKALYDVLKATYETVFLPIINVLKAAFVPLLEALNKAFGDSGTSVADLVAKFNPLIIAFRIALLPLQLLAKGLQMLTPIIENYVVPAFQSFVVLLAETRNGIADFVNAITQSGFSKQVQKTFGFEVGKVGKINIEELKKSFVKNTGEMINSTKDLDKAREAANEKAKAGAKELTDFEKEQIKEREKARLQELKNFIKAKDEAARKQKELIGFNTPERKLEADFTKATKEEAKKRHEARVDEMKNFKKNVTDPMIKIGEESSKREIEQIEKRRDSQILAVDTINQFTDTVSNALNEARDQRTDERLQRVQEETDIELALLQKRFDDGLVSEELFNKKKESLLKKQKEKEAAIKTRDAQADKRARLFTIAIDTAAAIIKAVASFPLTAGQPFAAIAAAMGAVQFGLVASMPIPKFAKGVTRFKGRGTDTSDSNLIAISNNESVVTARASKDHGDAIDALNKGQFRKYIEKNHVLPALNRMDRSKRKEEMVMANNMNNMVSLMKSKEEFYDGNIIRQLRNNKTVGLDPRTIKEIGKQVSKSSEEGGYF